ncbi:MAG: Rpn family recombination-promoting nuclease/putative transposase [Spirochaetaceae bacterium]|nr:Rpn family recombination-promoting nuclease/putative transposase [Spirochaetaceae bacterium]
MLTEQELLKKWETLTFTDDFMFSQVMHDEEICRQVVELILGIKIGKIEYLSTQEKQKTDPDSMAIIMDVYLRDENKVIKVEMQTGHKKELPKRSRYYQSVSDVSSTQTSTDYEKLPDNIVIFICTFDPFDQKIPFYTFYYTCEETDHKLKLNDGSLRIFLNTSAEKLTTLDAKLQAFYHYIQEGTVESDLAQNISDKITTLKNDSVTRRYYVMTSLKIADLQRDAYTEGREEGISIGAYEKALETARKLIARGDSPVDVAELLDLSLLEIQRLMNN